MGGFKGELVMRKFTVRENYFLIFVAFALAALLVYVHSKPTPPNFIPEGALPKKVSNFEFVGRAINISNPKTSSARWEVLSLMLAEVMEKRLTSQEEKTSWVALLAVESHFDGNLVSKTGAVGIGQIIPKFRNDFADLCKLGKVDEKDLKDDYLNATLSACYFHSLVKTFGNIQLAFIAYNQGAYSEDVKRAKKGKSISEEPRKYLKAIRKQQEATK